MKMTSVRVIAALSVFMVSGVLPYLPEEQECPDPENIPHHLFFAQPWVPPGTPSRAMLTLPPSFEVKPSAIPGWGYGLFTKTFIPGNTWLSEYEGEYIPPELGDERENVDFAWRVRRDGYDDRLVDALDESLGNWLRYVNCARNVTEENVEMTMCYGHIYFITSKPIVPNAELLIYCGDEYSETHLDTSRKQYFGGRS